MAIQRWRDVRDGKVPPEGVARDPAQGLTLRELRESLGVSQRALARAIAVDQSELSRAERRRGHRVATLRRYVEALGGQLEVTAVVGGKRVKLRDV